MRNIHARWLAGIVVCLVGLASLTASQPPAQAQTRLEPPPDPRLGLGTSFQTRFAYYYKPPENMGLDELARRFNVFILNSDNDETRNSLLALGGGRPMLAYLRSEAIQDPGSCTEQPWHNNVAYQVGDFCAISQQHPDWFLVDRTGARIMDTYQNEKFYLMDPANPEWQQFYIERARQVLADPDWDGVFLDNLEVTLNFRQQQNELPVKYPTDEAYWAAHESFLKALYSGYFKPNGKLLFANVAARKDETKFVSYLAYLDGAMHEGWSIDQPKRWRPVNTWEHQMALAEQAQKLGKFIILVGQGSQDDAALQAFAYSSYLLVANGQAAFRYGQSASYRQAWVYDNYALDLGAPKGPRYKIGSTWRRDFTNATISVDPQFHTARIGPPSGPPVMQLYLPLAVQ